MERDGVVDRDGDGRRVRAPLERFYEVSLGRDQVLGGDISARQRGDVGGLERGGAFDLGREAPEPLLPVRWLL